MSHDNEGGIEGKNDLTDEKRYSSASKRHKRLNRTLFKTLCVCVCVFQFRMLAFNFVSDLTNKQTKKSNYAKDQSFFCFFRMVQNTVRFFGGSSLPSWEKSPQIKYHSSWSEGTGRRECVRPFTFFRLRKEIVNKLRSRLNKKGKREVTVTVVNTETVPRRERKVKR